MNQSYHHDLYLETSSTYITVFISYIYVHKPQHSIFTLNSILKTICEDLLLP